MAKSVIDPNTGMPKLPEGDWWEVRKQSKKDYTFGFTYSYFTGYFEVVWFRIDHDNTKTEYYRDHWWSLKKTAHTVSDPKPVEKFTFSVYSDKSFDEDGDPQKATELTPETVRAAAERCYECATDLDEARQKTDTLLGKYPPNSLN